ncbi:MAG: DUF1080 domain-containing protein, partial [Chthoniobacteraceae bacterium]
MKSSLLFRPLFAAAIFVTSTFQIHAGDGESLSLFDGKTLEGWEQHSGKAEYRVEDGVIVGKTVLNTENSFLCTKKKYADFVLEFEFKVAPEM